mmetsp:Transcript_141509/g.343708  ORF Transcript_141509/g.343708 Transcript_141509/m.343708 type:complete len:222 (-) Transcript_141509:1464-2129(-)
MPGLVRLQVLHVPLHGPDGQQGRDAVRLVGGAPELHQAQDQLADLDEAVAVRVQNVEERIAVADADIELFKHVPHRRLLDHNVEGRLVDLHVEVRRAPGVVAVLPLVRLRGQSSGGPLREAAPPALVACGVRLLLTLLAAPRAEHDDHLLQLARHVEVLAVLFVAALGLVALGVVDGVLHEDGHDEVEKPEDHEGEDNHVAHNGPVTLGVVEVWDERSAIH